MGPPHSCKRTLSCGLEFSEFFKHHAGKIRETAPSRIYFIVFPSFVCAFYRIRPLGSGSDYSPFCQRAGVPSADIRYVFDMVCALH